MQRMVARASEDLTKPPAALSLSRPLSLALAANTVVLAIELAAAWWSNSLSLFLDAAHNLVDELALACLLLASVASLRASRRLRLLANVLNVAGIAMIAGAILWFSLQRLAEPPAVAGGIALAAALLAAAGNQCVALALRQEARRCASVRLAYLHNLGDVWLCLTAAFSGALVMLTGSPWVDPLLAGAIAAILLASAVRSLSFRNLSSPRAGGLV